MLEPTSLQKNAWECTSKPFKHDNIIHTGETVVYEGTTCKVTRVKPFLVIKCGNRVVCGNLLTQIKPVTAHNH